MTDARGLPTALPSKECRFQGEAACDVNDIDGSRRETLDFHCYGCVRASTDSSVLKRGEIFPAYLICSGRSSAASIS